MSEVGSIDQKNYIGSLMAIYDAPVSTINGPVPASELGWRFALSPYGRYMTEAQPLRFAQYFGYAPTHMEQDLGVDVLPMHHQIENAQYVVRIIEAEQKITGQSPINDDELGIAVFAALIHDMGESTHPQVLEHVGEVVGDIPHGEKTDRNREVEAKVRSFFYTELYSDVDPVILSCVESVISHSEESALHDIVEAAHVIQTFMTGMLAGAVTKAWQQEISEPKMQDEPMLRQISELVQLNKLSTTVLERMIPLVRYWATRFEYVKNVSDRFESILKTFEGHQ